MQLLTPTHVRKFRAWLENDKRHRKDLALSIKSLRFWPGSNIAFHSGDGTMRELQEMVAEIISAARNLRALDLNPFLLFYRNTCVGASIATLKHLVRLHLRTYDDAALAVLCTIESPLRHLQLSVDGYLLAMQVQTPRLQGVLSAISHLRNSLRTLEVFANLPDVPASTAASECVPFPAIRILRLIHPTSIPFDLYPLFPAAEIIKTSSEHTVQPRNEDNAVLLRRLKHLEAHPSEVLNHSKRFPRVSYLRLLGGVVKIMADGRLRELVDAIRCIDPVGLCFVVDIPLIGKDFWAGIGRAAPTLRCLMLIFRVTPLTMFSAMDTLESDSATIFLSHILRELMACADKLPPLVSLSIVVEHQNYRIRTAFDQLRAIDVNGSVPAHLSPITHIIHAFAHHVASAIPSLQHVGFAQIPPKADILDGGQGVCGWYEDVYDAELLAGDGQAQWWCVAEGAQGRQLEVVPIRAVQDSWCASIAAGK
ncbi:uncharacterized protein TRAVEDRAFT_48869 [Trametes versicolor FP-101664 SS1]|uniref:uncharacterized protein n=1 Tax=Trametes versicolor (strain FP-101664) TaxID=717944 RepID=UPI000462348B|nr:uncharacterized protein TRAVEDRAFT_48869 [Trametes versicolor FP-101664 SS1]EIW57842.1 hypothetical protein TRAVEDRAFT_48869 [Trametes versicolor FP-101664 SS1]